MKKNLETLLFGGLLVGTLIIGWSCKKDPQPTPAPTPTDTITPITPTDTIIPMPDDTFPPIPGRVAIFYVSTESLYDSISNTLSAYVTVPTLDTIRYLANHPGCDTIYIRWLMLSDYNWTWIGFVTPRDSLEKRFQISPKVFGGKYPYVVRTSQILPDDISYPHVLGMRRCDSLWYANHGYEVWIVN